MSTAIMEYADRADEVTSGVASGDNRDAPWYAETIGRKLGQPARELLENYSKIPADEIEGHVLKIRDEAYQIFPYPCIGEFRFLDLAISQSPYYDTILERLQTGNENLLDLGCCFGHDIRKLVADGTPSDHTYGCDLRQEFFDLGYKLFRDKETLQSKFIAADIFDPSSELSSLEGQMDIIFSASFLHLFGYKHQLEICKRMVKLLRDKKGSMILGRQIGNLVAGERTHERRDGKSRWRHNEESFKKMWDEVGELTGTKWRAEVETALFSEEERSGRGQWRDSEVTRLRFTVFREE